LRKVDELSSAISCLRELMDDLGHGNAEVKNREKTLLEKVEELSKVILSMREIIDDLNHENSGAKSKGMVRARQLQGDFRNHKRKKRKIEIPNRTDIVAER